MTEREWALNLALVPGIGGKLFIRLTEAFGSPRAVFQAPPTDLAQVPGVGTRAVENIRSRKSLREVSKILTVLEKEKIEFVLWGEEGYPSSLEQLDSPPPALFYKGNLQALEAPCLTIVGTRNSSRYGVNMAFKMAKDLAEWGYTIVSGLARGIDTAAHRGALVTGITVAFLGSGLDKVYPPENLNLAHEMIEKGGAVVSPFPPGTPPERGNFPRRNSLMAAAGQGVLVVEAGEKSGAVMTAQLAQSLGKPVFALPGQVGSPRTRGVHTLIKEGAHLVEEARDILEILRPGTSKMEAKDIEATPMTEAERKIWELLEEGPLPVEVIMERCRLSLQEAYTLLLEMELKGLISSGGGNIYERRTI